MLLWPGHRSLDALSYLWSPCPPRFFFHSAALPPYQLDIPLNNPDRRNIHLPPLHRIKPRSPQKDSSKHDNVPIHRIRLHRCGCGEKAKYKKGHKKHQRYDIDCRPRTAKGPTRWWQLFATQTLGEDAADG